MKILPGYSGWQTLRDKQIGRQQITEKDRQDWSKIEFSNLHQASRLQESWSDGRVRLDGVRWGFRETGSDSSQWQPIFKDATLDPSKIKDIYLTLEPFAPEFVAAHGMAIMEFSEPFQSSDGEKDSRLVLSVEAKTPKDGNYDLVKGLGRNFGMAYQLGSFSDQVQKVARKQGHRLMMHKLNLTQEAKEQFVKDALAASLKERCGEWYNTITNSCFTAQIDLLNGVLPPEKQLHRWTSMLRLARLSTSLPATGGVLLERNQLMMGRPLEILPDQQLHPQARPQPHWVSEASQSPLWGPGLRLVAGASAAALGYQLAGVAGAALGALGGGYLGGVIADKERIRHSAIPIEPNAFYPVALKPQNPPPQ